MIFGAVLIPADPALPILYETRKKGTIDPTVYVITGMLFVLNHSNRVTYNMDYNNYLKWYHELQGRVQYFGTGGGGHVC